MFALTGQDQFLLKSSNNSNTSATNTTSFTNTATTSDNKELKNMNTSLAARVLKNSNVTAQLTSVIEQHNTVYEKLECIFDLNYTLLEYTEAMCMFVDSVANASLLAANTLERMEKVNGKIEKPLVLSVNEDEDEDEDVDISAALDRQRRFAEGGNENEYDDDRDGSDYGMLEDEGIDLAEESELYSSPLIQQINLAEAGIYDSFSRYSANTTRTATDVDADSDTNKEIDELSSLKKDAEAFEKYIKALASRNSSNNVSVIGNNVSTSNFSFKFIQK